MPQQRDSSEPEVERFVSRPTQRAQALASDPERRRRRSWFEVIAHALVAWGAVGSTLAWTPGPRIMGAVIVFSALVQGRGLWRFFRAQARRREVMAWASEYYSSDGSPRDSGGLEMQIAKRRAALALLEREYAGALFESRTSLVIIGLILSLNVAILVPYNLWLGWSIEAGSPPAASIGCGLTSLLLCGAFYDYIAKARDKRRALERRREEFEALEYLRRRALREAEGGALSLAEGGGKADELQGALSAGDRVSPLASVSGE